MTKEDEARLAELRKCHAGCGEKCDGAFLLRLLDEQAAENNELRVKLNGYPFAIGGAAMDANITKRAVAANERARALEVDVKKMTAERDERAARVAALEAAFDEAEKALLPHATCWICDGVFAEEHQKQCEDNCDAEDFNGREDSPLLTHPHDIVAAIRARAGGDSTAIGEDPCPVCGEACAWTQPVLPGGIRYYQCSARHYAVAPGESKP